MAYRISPIDDLAARGVRRYGEKWDSSEIDSTHLTVRQAYGVAMPRVEVTTTFDDGETYVRRGRVGVTTGWRPAFLLMARRGNISSSDVLGPLDIVTATIDDRGRRHPIPAGRDLFGSIIRQEG